MRTQPVIFLFTGATPRPGKGNKMKRSQIIGRWASFAGTAVLIATLIAGL